VKGLLSLFSVLVVLAVPAGKARALMDLSAGDLPPPFSLPTVAGKEYSLEYLAGGPGVIGFWSTWSPRSAEVLEVFRQHYDELSPKGLKFLAVNVDGENLSPARREAVRSYIAERNLPFPVLLDERLEAFSAYGIMAHPTVVVIDSGGRIAYVLGGYPLSLREELRDNLLKVVGLYVPPPKEELPAVGYVPVGGALQYYNLGLNLMAKGQSGRALDSFRKAAERDPLFLEPGVMAARISLASGDKEPAEALMRSVDADSINRGDLRYLAGILLLAKGRPEEATRVFARLVEHSPREGWGQWGLGMVLVAGGDAKGGLEKMREASSLQPGNLEAESFLRRRFVEIWRQGGTPQEEEGFVALFPALEDLRGRYRKMFRSSGSD